MRWNPPLMEVHMNYVKRPIIDCTGISNIYIHAHMDQIQYFNNTYDREKGYILKRQLLAISRI